MSAHKSPVTCHVLIASTGIPGKNVAVKIEQLDQTTADFKVLATS
jgi:5-hydroxyisourate hydrolase